MNKPTIALGQSDFENLREGGHFYVDKSLLIEEVIQDTNPVVLLPRPRRFGKTLNLSMLHYFFDNQRDYSGLFTGLAITKSPAWEHQGKYPVVMVSFRSCKGPNWEAMQHQLAKAISAMVEPHLYLLKKDGLWRGNKREKFEALLDREAPKHVLQDSLLFITQLLEEYHGIAPILLLDEYDTPLIEAYNRGYYAEARDTIQILFGDALKDNKALGKAIITGILRVAKESLFSGLNNLTVATVLDEGYADKFGFTPEEVKKGLEAQGLPEHYEDVDTWYNGYRFGKHQIYNPWSILNYLQKPTQGFRPYWVNTSENSLLIRQFEQASFSTITQLEKLMQGEVLESELKDHTVFQDLERPKAMTLMTFLVFSGYLYASFDRQEETKYYYQLRIPNKEVLAVYQTIFERYFEQTLDTQPTQEMLEGLLNGNIALFERYLKGYVLEAFSYYDLADDAPEKIYHAFMMGTLGYLFPTHKITSNREVGLGRADMLLIPKDADDRRGYVLEFKRAERAESLKATAQEALEQIEQRQYTAELLAEKRQVYAVGIAFFGKQVALAYAPFS
ncbi:MAG TPA: AAA family ATPase [Cytophagales bacterium]|nr:AAA family ATPase [Cytophagales bacterium]HAA18867.1 AAA family ATPase [Cytophagales bacterium]HAP62221.1 AAA family ATPase [Cytophagales bacterium]